MLTALCAKTVAMIARHISSPGSARFIISAITILFVTHCSRSHETTDGGAPRGVDARMERDGSDGAWDGARDTGGDGHGDADVYGDARVTGLPTYHPCNDDEQCGEPGDLCLPVRVVDGSGAVRRGNSCSPMCEIDGDCPSVDDAPGACIRTDDGTGVCVAPCEHGEPGMCWGVEHCTYSQSGRFLCLPP